MVEFRGAWQELVDWPKRYALDISDYVSAVKSFLPEATDEQKAYLWERAVAERASGDSERIYWAEHSMFPILRFSSEEQRRQFLNNFDFDTLSNGFVAPVIVAIYASALKEPERRETFEKSWQQAIKWGWQRHHDSEFVDAEDNEVRQPAAMPELLSHFDAKIILEKWNEIITSYENDSWDNGTYYDPDMGGDRVSGLYTFRWLNALAHAIPAEYTAVAVRQICDIQYYSAHPYRRAGVIKRLIAGNEAGSRILRETYERLLAETEVPDYSARDPFAIAAELVLLMPEASREDEMMARVSYAIRKSLRK